MTHAKTVGAQARGAPRRRETELKVPGTTKRTDLREGGREDAPLCFVVVALGPHEPLAEHIGNGRAEGGGLDCGRRTSATAALPMGEL